MRSPDPGAGVAAFCDEVLAHDLPDLPTDRRAEVVAFAGRRIAGLPSPMRLGVGAVAVVVGGAGRVVGARPGRPASSPAARCRSLGEYVRLVRSLGYAYVWETWPATTPTGGRR